VVLTIGTITVRKAASNAPLCGKRRQLFEGAYRFWTVSSGHFR